jgi:hypothetical protein
MRQHYCGGLLRWLHHLSTQVPNRGGAVHGAVQMNDDDTDSGGDFFFDLMKTLIALFFFILAILLMGGIIWGLIA